MARYQIVFRNRVGDHIMLVDDPTHEGEKITYIHQSLDLGSIVKTNGHVWVVSDDSEVDGLRRIICDPVA
jgi:hypothetical protein